MILYTFSVSHFSEKIRWTLDHAGYAYTERRLTPFFHVPITLAKGGRKATTVPILEVDGQCIQDSTRILLRLEKHHGLALLGQGAEREAVLEWEDTLDKVGSQIIGLAYATTLERKEDIVMLWSLDATPMQARLLDFGFPLLRMAFRRLFKINPQSAARSRTKVGVVLDRIEAHLATGAQCLVGNTFSAADLTAAALLAPLVCPDEHPVYSRVEFRASMAPVVGDWQDRPAFMWVRKLYREQRRKA